MSQNFNIPLFLLLIVLLNSSMVLCTFPFETKFFVTLNSEYKGKNLIVSPLSIYQVLSLAANGANGNTQSEILSTISQNPKMSEVNSNNYYILNYLRNYKTVEEANAVMTRFTPADSFSNIAEKYLAPVEPLESAAQVNDWVFQKTHGKITKIVDYLDEDVSMVLLNAIYFKGKWASPFDKEYTKKKPFYANGNKDNEQLVDTMNKTEEIYYYETSEYQAIELPYKEDDMTAIIFLPKENIDINNFINDITPNIFQEFFEESKLHKVHLEMPKFKLNFESSLINTLQKMGIESAFDPIKSDFSGLRNTNDSPYIGEIIQKTFLEVNEVETEAAAATGAWNYESEYNPKEIKEVEMIINRPFLFFIRNYNMPYDNQIMFVAKIETIE